MNILDIIIGVPVLWMAYRGFAKGFVIEATTLIALVLGIYAAINFSFMTAGFLRDYFTLKEQYLSVLAFAITFIAVVFGVVLIGRLLEKFINMIALGFLDKLAGGIFGIAKAAFIISAILLVINSVDIGNRLISQKLKDNSVFYGPVESVVPTVLPMIDFESMEMPLEKKQIEDKIVA